MGGGDFFRYLLDAGLVDEVETALVPILLGGGLPLVPPGRTHRLRLQSQQPYPSGIVLMTYSVEAADEDEERA